MARDPDAVKLAIAEQAAEWMIRLDEDDDLARRQALIHWLTQSPIHIEEFLLARAACRVLRGIDPDREIQIAASTSLHGSLIRLTPIGIGADAEPDDAPKVDRHLGELRADGERQRVVPAIRKPVWFGCTIAISLLLVGIYFPFELTASRTTYATAIGEQRSVTLEDGSVVRLNTRSRVDVSYSKESRDIRLLQGEALFTVTHDATRPFRVHTDTITAEAVGTQFDVYRRPADTVVSVIEGQVRLVIVLSLSPSHSGEESLKAGEKAVIGTDGSLVKRRNTLAKSLDRPGEIAWTVGEIRFDDVTVADATAEFNRYNVLQLELTDPATAAIRVGGVFRSNSPASFVKVLESSFGVEVLPTEPGRDVIRLTRRTP